MNDDPNTTELTLQVKDDGSVVIDSVKNGPGEIQKMTVPSIDVLSSVKDNWLTVARKKEIRNGR